jgi:hypothetical protein
MRTSLIRLFSVFILCQIWIIGCSNGGTSGTGLRTYQGKVSKLDSTPLTNANVIIQETGETSSTKSEGQFSLISQKRLTRVIFNIESDEIKASLPIENIPQETDSVNIDVQVDTTKNEATATRIDFGKIKKIELSVQIIGSCGKYFESNKIVKQISRRANGRQCTLQASVTGDGIPQAAAFISLERRSCNSQGPWRRVASKRTPSGVQQGKVEIPFTFLNNRQNCQYRVVAGEIAEKQDILYFELLKNP